MHNKTLLKFLFILIILCKLIDVGLDYDFNVYIVYWGIFV